MIFCLEKVVRTRLTIIGLLLLLACFLLFRPTGSDQVQSHTVLLPSRTDAGYATSDSCVSCHPSQHASWHDSYHRKMTQLATPATVVGDFDNVQLETGGQTAQLERRGDEFWVVDTADQSWEQEKFAEWAQTRGNDGNDPYAGDEPPRVDAQVVMTTGSHHFQAYWIKGKQGRELWQFPWRYHIAEQRWVHRKDVFLTPPEWRPGMWFRVWNSQCIYCHSTGPYPGRDLESGVMADTKIAELGISCEACHGPAEQHVAFHRSEGKSGTDKIINPAKVDHRVSAQICGSCHSHFSHNDPMLAVHGPQYRPGANLYHFGDLKSPPEKPEVMSRFWGDGTNRSGGREFSGMSQSECYLQADLSCVSCHSMHDSDPNDQLSETGISAEACLQCHQQFRNEESLTEHTHHALGSTGSECYNCHMPHTNYALYKGIRSHQITVPQVVAVRSNSRPNACNLCHLDQTQQWAADHLHDWYGLAKPELSFDDRTISAGVLWALKGDAGQRVIAAWHFGWEPARAVAGSDWMLPTIGQLMKDPYAAVRWVAFDSLRKDSNYRDTKFDFDVSAQQRDNGVTAMMAEWTLGDDAAKLDSAKRSRLLLDARGKPNLEQINAVLGDRDERMVAGVE